MGRGLRALAVSGLLLGSSVARAGAERSWESLYDARLAQALDGTPAAAAIYCKDVLDDLQPTDPLLGRAWYFLGQARAEQGDAQGAADAWEQAANAAIPSLPARALLARFDELGKPMEALPRACTFDDSLCGLHRVWTRKGEPVLLPSSEGRVLSWTTEVKASSSDSRGIAGGDALEAVFRAPATVHTVSFRVRASAIVSYLRVALDDGTGARVQSGVVNVPTDAWTEVELPVDQFRPAEQGGWSGKARLFRVEDLTGLLSEDRGPNELWIDDLELR